MKKSAIIFSIFLLLLLNILMLPSIAQSRSYEQGIYTANQLNLSENTTHTIKNDSTNEYAFVIIFDSNQIVQQLIQLEPQSGEYILEPIESGYLLIIVGKGKVIIS
ncbi:hypothetical protein [uncultured Clostridium sp.]|uniref:hypothetical protein n=1 Tax=uncultured Clostridium sp. TaxID=59620 RepID=UPI0028F127B4|nr:hypothetical protein [uncultured Clostridium sp.]